MIDALFRITHVLGKPTVDVILEAIHIVLLAHPVLAALAESTLPTRNDLL